MQKKERRSPLTDIEALVCPTSNKRAPTPFGVSVLTYVPKSKNYQFSMPRLKAVTLQEF